MNARTTINVRAQSAPAAIRLAIFMLAATVVRAGASAAHGQDEMPPIPGVYSPVQYLDLTLGRLMPISSAQQRGIRAMEIEYRQQCAAALARHDITWLDAWSAVLDAENLSAEHAKRYATAATTRQAVISECFALEQMYVEQVGKLLTDEQREILTAWFTTTRGVERALSRVPLRMSSPQTYGDIARRIDELVERPDIAAQLQQKLQRIESESLRAIRKAINEHEDGSQAQRGALVGIHNRTLLSMFEALADTLLADHEIGEQSAEILFETICEGFRPMASPFASDHAVRAMIRAGSVFENQAVAAEVRQIGAAYWTARRPLWQELMHLHAAINGIAHVGGPPEAVDAYSEKLQEYSEFANDTQHMLVAVLRPHWDEFRRRYEMQIAALEFSGLLWVRLTLVEQPTDHDDAAEQLSTLVGVTLFDRAHAKRGWICDALEALSWADEEQSVASRTRLRQLAADTTTWLAAFCDDIPQEQQARARLLILDHVLPGRAEVSVGAILTSTHPSAWLTRQDETAWRSAQDAGIGGDLLELWATSIEWQGVAGLRVDFNTDRERFNAKGLRLGELEKQITQQRLQMIEAINQCTDGEFVGWADLYVAHGPAASRMPQDQESLERITSLRVQAAEALLECERVFKAGQFWGAIPIHLEARLVWVIRQLQQQ